ncbi:MAG: hypothetical protein ABS882_10655, partial [Lysinibacillus sp.]
GRYEDAYLLNEDLINEFKKIKGYTQIALCFLRKGLLQKKLAIHDVTDYIEKAYFIAEIFDDTSLKKQLIEFEKNFNK